LENATYFASLPSELRCFPSILKKTAKKTKL